MELDTEDDSGEDDGRQGGLGYEGGVGHEEGEAEDNQRASVHPAQWGPHPARAVHRCPGEGARGRHGLDKRSEYVAQAQSNHFLAGIHRPAAGKGLSDGDRLEDCDDWDDDDSRTECGHHLRKGNFHLQPLLRSLVRAIGNIVAQLLNGVVGGESEWRGLQGGQAGLDGAG